MSQNLSFFRRACLWSRIKPFGELSILTRASYLLLFFVPVLAGVWPVVTKYIFAGTLMPKTWVLAFLASLLVMAGQTLYQIFAPDVVREWTRADYISKEIKRYYENPTAGELQWAKSVLSDAKIRQPESPQQPNVMAIVEEQGVRVAREAETVGIASQVHYDTHDKKYLLPAFLSATCYIVGLGILVRILVVQTDAVLRAGGVL